MNQPASVLLLGGAELTKVKQVLEGLGVEARHERSGGDGVDLACPSGLLVTSARAAEELSGPLEPDPGEAKPVWIAIHNQVTAGQRSRLAALGVDYLVSASVDLEVLRMLFLHALYRGPERRDAARVPVGARVQCRHAGQAVRATLAEIAPQGCRIFSELRAEPGDPIVVELPAELCGGEPLGLSGRVRRAAIRETGAANEPIALAVEFEAGDSTDRLQALMEGKAPGSRVSRLADEQAADRRRSARAPYPRKVFPLASDAAVLMAHDLSVDGMRVEPSAGLEVGSSLQLAIYGASREEPIIVEARVVRDCGDGGSGLCFVAPDATTQQRLRSLVESCAVESLSARSDVAGPVFLTRKL
jgi:hypothetical protein